MNKRFVNSFGPAYGQDDRTDFLYDNKDHCALKKLVDGVNVTIYRDGSIGDGNLDVLIRRAEICGVEFAAQMIPVKGMISHIETQWTADTQENYKLFSYSDHVDIGIMQDKDVIHALTIWYSKDGYLRANPKRDVDTTNTLREHTAQEPIIIPLNK